MKQAQQLAEDIMSDLGGRKGVLDGIGDDMIEEITDDLQELIQERLDKTAEAFPLLAGLHDSLVLKSEYQGEEPVKRFVQSCHEFNAARVFLHRCQ